MYEIDLMYSNVSSNKGGCDNPRIQIWNLIFIILFPERAGGCGHADIPPIASIEYRDSHGDPRINLLDQIERWLTDDWWLLWSLEKWDSLGTRDPGGGLCDWEQRDDDAIPAALGWKSPGNRWYSLLLKTNNNNNGNWSTVVLFYICACFGKAFENNIISLHHKPLPCQSSNNYQSTCSIVLSPIALSQF